MAESDLIQNGDTKQPTLPEATTIWANDLLWSWINTQLAKKEAKRLGKDPIHYACTVVLIPPGDSRRNLPPEDVLRRLGHNDIIAKLGKDRTKIKDAGAQIESKQIFEETTNLPPTPIETWIAHHIKRGVKLQGSDGQAIDWPWCLAMWDKLGRPVVYAAPGDPFYDLSLYMYPEKLSPQRLQGIVSWLEEHSVANKFGAR